MTASGNKVLHAELRKTLADWLRGKSHRPDAIALDISTRLRRDRVDLAALWLKQPENQESAPGMRVALFICCASRKECWAECADAELLVAAIAELRTRRETVEAAIREQEPELRDKDTLFEELSVWNYKLSANPEYHDIQKQIDNLEQILYGGSRIEHISNAPAADQLYMVVPRGMLSTYELREDWGLIEFFDNNLNIVRKAKSHKPPMPDKLLMLKRILASSSNLAISSLENELKNAKVAAKRKHK